MSNLLESMGTLVPDIFYDIEARLIPGVVCGAWGCYAYRGVIPISLGNTESLVVLLSFSYAIGFVLSGLAILTFGAIGSLSRWHTKTIRRTGIEICFCSYQLRKELWERLSNIAEIRPGISTRLWKMYGEFVCCESICLGFLITWLLLMQRQSGSDEISLASPCWQSFTIALASLVVALTRSWMFQTRLDQTEHVIKSTLNNHPTPFPMQSN